MYKFVPSLGQGSSLLCLGSAEPKGWLGRWTASLWGGQVCPHFIREGWRLYGSTVAGPRSTGILWEYKDAQPKGLSSLLVPEGASITHINNFWVSKKSTCYIQTGLGSAVTVWYYTISDIHSQYVRHNLCHHIHLLFIWTYHDCTLLIMSLLSLKIIWELKKGAMIWRLISD